MTNYLLKISGVHYAANPNCVSGQPDTQEMHMRTHEMLNWIKDNTPLVVLTPEPSNRQNPDAVMARAMGKRIGYVGDDWLKTAKSLLSQSTDGMLLARVRDVEVVNHGAFWVTVEAEELSRMVPLSSSAINWDMWLSNMPLLPLNEGIQAELEAAFVLERVLLPKINEIDVKELNTYLTIWLQGSRHDLSREARQKRTAYIEMLEAAQRKEVRQLAVPLKRQRTSICGRPLLNERTSVWWQGLMDSSEVQLLWHQWQLKNENKLWHGLKRIDTLLRQLPGELYQDIGQLDVVLSRLYYMNTPRQALQAILGLMILRQLTCKQLSIAMRPMTEADYQQDGFISNPMDMPTTIGRVVDFGETQCELPLQRQTIQLLAQWLRDDYEQSHSKEIEALVKEEKTTVAVNGDIVLKKETNIDKNYAPNIENNGMLSLPNKDNK